MPNVSFALSTLRCIGVEPVTRFELKVERLFFGYEVPFRISGHVMDGVSAIEVTLSDAIASGRGEAAGVYYLSDDVDHMVAEIEARRDALETCPDRETLRQILPPGGARNAVDCAMWEHESRARGIPVWCLAGPQPPRPLVTTFTLSADPPDVLARSLAQFPSTQAIKMKLDGDFATDSARVAAVRQACPDSWLGVDANQGYDATGLEDLVGMLADARVSVLEQPVRRGSEQEIEGLRAPMPVIADESVLCLAELEDKARYFDGINIKLDKCGGLTEGLKMADRARELGLRVMVGNMGGSTLATAPAFVLAQTCDHVDLDGPWFIDTDPLARDIYKEGNIFVSPGIWGADSDQR